MKQRLLVAETDPAVAERYRSVFSAAGYRVEIASDGVDCVRRFRRAAPDLLVLDQELLWGGSDGVLACMRDDCDWARIPVVVIAAVLPAAKLWQMRFPPVVRCLPKPVPMPALRDVVDSLVSPAS